MRVHHLNCGTCCPIGGALMDGRSKGLTAHLVCHCLLLETNAGLVLVDTGFGLRDCREARADRVTPGDRLQLRPRLREEECAVKQVRALGFEPATVRHIVLTHLDFDHAGGIEDFPGATVHVMARELAAATGPRHGYVPRNRYRPPQFDEVGAWRRYEAQAGEPWFGFDAVRQLDGLPPEILMIPLPGHTLGHAGIAIDTGAGWLLHAGDAYFHHGEVRRPSRSSTPLKRAYQTLMEADRTRRLANQARVRRLSIERAAEVKVLCSHDTREFDRAQAGQLL